MTSQPSVMSSKCESRLYMAILASKWSLLVINSLADQPQRNGQLMRAIDGISQKMLTQTLRQLEEINIISRRDFRTVPPHVLYELTDLGRSLKTEVHSLIRWIETHMPDLQS